MTMNELVKYYYKSITLKIYWVFSFQFCLIAVTYEEMIAGNIVQRKDKGRDDIGGPWERVAHLGVEPSIRVHSSAYKWIQVRVIFDATISNLSRYKLRLDPCNSRGPR